METYDVHSMSTAISLDDGLAIQITMRNIYTRDAFITTCEIPFPVSIEDLEKALIGLIDKTKTEINERSK